MPIRVVPDDPRNVVGFENRKEWFERSVFTREIVHGEVRSDIDIFQSLWSDELVSRSRRDVAFRNRPRSGARPESTAIRFEMDAIYDDTVDAPLDDSDQESPRERAPPLEKKKRKRPSLEWAKKDRDLIANALDDAQRRLLNYYVLLDSSLCFILQRNLACKRTVLERLMNSISPTTRVAGVSRVDDDGRPTIDSVIEVTPHLIRVAQDADLVSSMDDAPGASSTLDSFASSADRRDPESVRVFDVVELVSHKGTSIQSQKKRRKLFLRALTGESIEHLVPRPGGAKKKRKTKDGAALGNTKALVDEAADAKDARTYRDLGGAAFDPSTLLEALKSDDELYEDQVVYVEPRSRRDATFEDLSPPLHPTLDRVLREVCAIRRLFTHQSRAISSIREERDVVIATSTSSGKSLCYLLPILERLCGGVDSGAGFVDESSSESTALLMFPTKALTQDQFSHVARIVGPLNDALRSQGRREITISIFDGDTPFNERNQIRESVDVLLTNPDMLHVTLLPDHKKWSRFVGRLQLIVIDEAHTFRGVFGSHVANVLRRLDRVCDFHRRIRFDDRKKRPTYVCCSATIADPVVAMTKLIPVKGIEFDCIESNEDGSPLGESVFCLWVPPLKKKKEVVVAAAEEERQDESVDVDPRMKERKSAIFEAARLLTFLVRSNVKTLCFAGSRKVVELVLKYAHMKLTHEHSHKIRGYRGGYTKKERRSLEKAIFTGTLTAIVATNALELGIDIGHLDCVLTLGFPGSVSSLRQQLGRAGRGGRKAFTAMIAFDSPLDRYLTKRPSLLFSNVETSFLDGNNELIATSHMLCAGRELPLKRVGESDLYDAHVERLVSGKGFRRVCERERRGQVRADAHKV